MRGGVKFDKERPWLIILIPQIRTVLLQRGLLLSVLAHSVHNREHVERVLLGQRLGGLPQRRRGRHQAVVAADRLHDSRCYR